MLESLLERINQQEFELLSEDIKSALADHHLWMQQINLAIASRESLHEDSFIGEDAHQHCHFGVWLRKLLEDEGFKNDAFTDIDQLHQQLHSTARQLLLSFAKTQQFNATDYANLLDIQRLFFNTVLQVLEFSVVSKNQFDPTTKLMNRRSVHTILANEKHRMQRIKDSSCCIAIGDIDNFKNFNDEYGHDLGDSVLAHVATIFNDTIRRYDSVARFGGEEFLFVLPDMSIEDAAQALERVRTNLATSPFLHQGKPLSITASFGVTQLCRYCDINGSIKRADVALYNAKNNGRNKTVCVDSRKLIEELKLCTVDPTPEELESFIRNHCEIVPSTNDLSLLPTS